MGDALKRDELFRSEIDGQCKKKNECIRCRDIWEKMSRKKTFRASFLCFIYKCGEYLFNTNWKYSFDKCIRLFCLDGRDNMHSLSDFSGNPVLPKFLPHEQSWMMDVWFLCLKDCQPSWGI